MSDVGTTYYLSGSFFRQLTVIQPENVCWVSYIAAPKGQLA